MPPVTVDHTSPKQMSFIQLDGIQHEVVEVRATGDVILDVTFENTSSIDRSIPTDALQRLRSLKAIIPSPRIFYRVRIDTLKKCSKYFEHLLSSDVFGEGRAIKDAFSKLSEANLKPSEIEPGLLPRIKIVDEDDATKTSGREYAFRDMLRIIHGAEHLTKPVSIIYQSVLVVLADRFDCLAAVSRYVTGTFGKFKYPQTVDRAGEDLLRQKILIFYRTNQALQLSAASKELILRGSSRWTSCDINSGFSTAWWDLPDGLESELSHRRACIIRTIASVQMHFIALYTSRARQCSLGYDTSPACDSFQLGEMISFLTKKGLLSLIPFQSVSPEEPDYMWPGAYSGDVEQLIGLLRQIPPYQIDKNHHHCGLRVRILPALDYIKDCIDTGIGINPMRWKSDRAAQTWMHHDKSPNGNKKKPFEFEGGTAGEKSKSFDFAKAKSMLQFGANSMQTVQMAKSLFTSQKWAWTPAKEEENTSMLKTSLKW